jgi:hypothetical protein
VSILPSLGLGCGCEPRPHGRARWRARGRGKVVAGIDQVPAQPAPCRPELWRSPGRGRWIRCREAGPLDLGLGCPLWASAAMQACGSSTSSSGPAGGPRWHDRGPSDMPRPLPRVAAAHLAAGRRVASAGSGSARTAAAGYGRVSDGGPASSRIERLLPVRRWRAGLLGGGVSFADGLAATVAGLLPAVVPGRRAESAPRRRAAVGARHAALLQVAVEDEASGSGLFAKPLVVAGERLDPAGVTAGAFGIEQLLEDGHVRPPLPGCRAGRSGSAGVARPAPGHDAGQAQSHS